jgi:hypothetical protein
MIDYKKYKIKERLQRGDNEILLLEMFKGELLPKESVANVVAIDTNKNLLWIIERPQTKYDIYSNIYFKEENLFAFTDGGQLHKIDIDTGKVITSKMLK